MVQRVFNKSERFNDLRYQEYLSSLKISSDFFKGDCPSCSRIFKIKPLPFEKIDDSTKYPAIHCPYCGHYDYYHSFFTDDISNILLDSEKRCPCGLIYSYSGVTVICPNCVIFNARQFFFEEISKIESLLSNGERWDDLSDLVSKIVSLFDGYGRAILRFQYNSGVLPASVKRISFQNLNGANFNIGNEFGIKIEDFVTHDEWLLICIYFHRRHLIAHALGVVDQEYVDKTGDTSVVVGQRVPLNKEEIRSVIEIIRHISTKLFSLFAS